jgi:hypothetical protein
MSLSAPVIAFAIVGGFLGRVMAREDTYQHLKIFDDVVGLIASNYVEEVTSTPSCAGDARSKGSTRQRLPDARRVKQVEAGTPPRRRRGPELTRQYYLRVIAARDLASREGRTALATISERSTTPRRARCRWGRRARLRGALGTKVRSSATRPTRASSSSRAKQNRPRR